MRQEHVDFPETVLLAGSKWCVSAARQVRGAVHRGAELLALVASRVGCSIMAGQNVVRVQAGNERGCIIVEGGLAPVRSWISAILRDAQHQPSLPASLEIVIALEVVDGDKRTRRP